MTKTELLEDLLLIARKENNTIAKSVLTTLKGEMENETKKGTNPEEALESLAKKGIKNLKSFTESPRIETERLLYEQFVPTTMTEAETSTYVKQIVAANLGLVLEIKQGNKGIVGKLMGLIMKGSKRVNAKLASKILDEVITSLIQTI